MPTVARESNRMQVVVVLALAAGWLLAHDAHAQGTSPFVAGFARFFDESPGQQEGGRLLLSELSCTACHPTAARELQPKRGPRLDGAGRRLQMAWVRRFLLDPQHSQPGTTMPDLLANRPPAEKEAIVDALLAFLSRQHRPLPDLQSSATFPVAHRFWEKGDSQHGGRLYHQLGCVACHEPDPQHPAAGQLPGPFDRLLAELDPEEIAQLGWEPTARPVASVPLAELAAKYSYQSLTFFLLDPLVVRPAARMPDLNLAPDEAADVAAYLLQREAKPDKPAAPSALPAADGEVPATRRVSEGRSWFHELGCANCHDVAESFERLPANPLADLAAGSSSGCLSRAAPGRVHYSLSDAQIDALRLALAAQPAPDQLDSAAAASLRLLQLNCYACHQRNRRGGVAADRRPYFETASHVDLGDEGRIPPDLTGVGSKLRESWLREVLSGQQTVRPYMLARMPHYPPVDAAALASWLVSDDDRPTRHSEPSALAAGDADRTAGRQLIDTGCVQCHPLRGERLPGVMGVDLKQIEQRLQPSWLRAFLLNPAELKPGTRMPTFFPNGRSASPQILEGDVEQQIAAIWAYLTDLDNQELPEKILAERVHNFELTPQDRPILLRTFMERAGLRAIAVGFAEQVHFAYDAERLRPAEAWKGRFLDAHGTWFDRFTPPARPLGDERIDLPPGPTLARLQNPEQSWPAGNKADVYQFRGYRLDTRGVPTFLYDFDQLRVEERLEPGPDRTLTRHLRLIAPAATEHAAPLWLRVHAGRQLEPRGPWCCRDQQGLNITLVQPRSSPGAHREQSSLAEWIVPLPPQQEVEIELELQW